MSAREEKEKKKHCIKSVCKNFRIQGRFIESAALGSGHINDTFKATFEKNGRKVAYAVQRINHQIFKNPIAMMENIDRVTRHVREKIAKSANPRRKVLDILKTKEGNSFFIDADGSFWRVFEFIENAKAYDMLETPEQGFQAAKAFGEFQKMLADMPGERLHETIPDFHNTPQRLKNFEKVLDKDTYNRAKLAKREIEFVEKRTSVAHFLLNLHRKGKIPERITHNDTKLNNVLLDAKTGKAVCVIDLDTVMPGLAPYDFGDIVRTGANASAEDEKDLSKIKIRLDVFEALARGYLSESKSFLTNAEIESLPFSGKLISFETGMRFLTDFLSGDIYFKCHRQNHNLDRCRAQFKLVEEIESLEGQMHEIIRNIISEMADSE